MQRLIVGDPGHFSAKQVTGTRACRGLPHEAKQPLENGHSAEDWSRAYWLIKSRIRMGSRGDKEEATARQRNEDHVEPLFLTIEKETNRHPEANMLCIWKIRRGFKDNKSTHYNLVVREIAEASVLASKITRRKHKATLDPTPRMATMCRAIISSVPASRASV